MQRFFIINGLPPRWDWSWWKGGVEEEMTLCRTSLLNLLRMCILPSSSANNQTNEPICHRPNNPSHERMISACIKIMQFRNLVGNVAVQWSNSKLFCNQVDHHWSHRWYFVFICVKYVKTSTIYVRLPELHLYHWNENVTTDLSNSAGLSLGNKTVKDWFAWTELNQNCVEKLISIKSKRAFFVVVVHQWS